MILIKKLTINEEKNWYDLYLLKEEISKVTNELKKKQLSRNKYGI